LGNLDLPSVVLTSVGDWESDKILDQVVLDFSEEDLVDLVIRGEEE